MDPGVVLRRTEIGDRALEAHDHDLPRALRHALIFVDGRSRVEQLLRRGAVIPDLDDALRELLRRGFVAPVGGVPAAPGGTASGADVRGALLNLARASLGDRADKVLRKIEAAGADATALAEAVESSHKLIRLTIDEGAAEEFRRAARNLLAGAGRP